MLNNNKNTQNLKSCNIATAVPVALNARFKKEMVKTNDENLDLKKQKKMSRTKKTAEKNNIFKGRNVKNMFNRTKLIKPKF